MRNVSYSSILLKMLYCSFCTFIILQKVVYTSLKVAHSCFSECRRSEWTNLTTVHYAAICCLC